MRTIEEIRTRLEEALDDPHDMFGAKAERLIAALPFEEAVSAGLNPSIDEEEWAKRATLTEDSILAAFVDYLPFAMGKADDHRGLSAARSIQHMEAFVFLLGDDADVNDFADMNYVPYGVPMLKWMADRFEASEVWAANSTPALERMAKGLPCIYYCESCTA